MTYMNLSGEAVRELINYYKMDAETELVVIYDDIDLDPGQIRIRQKRQRRWTQWNQKHYCPSLEPRISTELK